MRRDRTAVLYFLAQVVRSVVGFGTTLIAARYFGAGGLGIYSQVLALLFWLKLPSNSLTTAISKRMSESTDRTGHFTAGLVAALGYGLAIAAVILMFRDLVNGYLNANAAVLLVALILGNITFDIVKSGFVGRKRVAVSGWFNTAEQILRLVAQVAFVLGGTMVIGLVYGHVVSLAVFAVIGVVLLRDSLRIPTAGDFDDLRRFAQYSWLGNLKGLALSWMDILVLGLFVGNEFVGIYQASWTLASFLALTSKSIGTTLFPEMSALGARESYDQARSLLGDAVMFAGVFLIPGLFGALVVGDRVLEIYEQEFAMGATILVLLIGARTVHAFGNQLMTALNGLDYPEIAFRINAVFFATNLVLNVALVYYFGWYGAAVATLTSTCVYLAGAWYAIQRIVGGIDIPFREIGIEIFASLVMVGGLVVVLPLVPRNVFTTVAVVLVGAGIYGIVLLGLSTRIRGKVRAIASL